MKETRTEYLARITAEHPGDYGRIDELMGEWDHRHGYLDGAADVQGPRPVPVPADLLTSGGNSQPVRETSVSFIRKQDLEDNAAPEGGDAAPSNAPPKDTEQP